MISVLGLSLLSCQPEKCSWEIEMYKQHWNYTVKQTYQHDQFKATYVIETVEGKNLLFRPIQGIYTSAEPGDKIIKERNSNKAALVKMNWEDKDTIEFRRIFSPSCDEIIENLNSKK